MKFVGIEKLIYLLTFGLDNVIDYAQHLTPKERNLKVQIPLGVEKASCYLSVKRDSLLNYITTFDVKSYSARLIKELKQEKEMLDEFRLGKSN